MKENRKNSIKKLLLCILCSVIVATSLGMTKLFLEYAPIFMAADFSTTINEESEEFIKYLKALENGTEEIQIFDGDFYYSSSTSKQEIEEFYKRIKEDYGEDYPAEGLVKFRLDTMMNIVQTQDIVETYALSVIRGIAFGAMVYIIVIQKATGKKLLLEILIGAVIILILMALANFGYEFLYNVWMDSAEENLTTGYNSYIYDFEDSRILIGFVVLLIAIYIGNLINQKRITKKLNEEIEKINE